MMSDNFNPLEMAKKSRTFCILPWIHQYAGPRGDVKPCCVYNHSEEIGNLKVNSLEEIWNNDKTKEMRLKFLNGEEDSNCGSCNSRMEISAAFKTEFNKEFFEYNKRIRDIVASTNKDGSLNEHKILYMDVRFNNLCNFACRTCGPHFSTSWIIDSRKLYNKKFKEDYDDGFQFAGKTESDALEQMIPHLANIKHIYFAGGEPLMQHEHFEVLNRLINLGNDTVTIRYNTNFSSFKLGKYDVVEYWKKFNNVHVNASLDGNKLKAEYWRHGTVWKDIVSNRQRMLDEVPHVKFNIGFVLSWPNVYNLIEFHREWTELGYIKVDNMIVNLLDTPYYYSIKNIPDWKKEKIEAALRDHITWLKEQNALSETIFKYETAINYMWSRTNKHDNLEESIKNFSRITKKLDSIRNESFFDVFPEHKDIEEYIAINNLYDEFNY